MSNNEQKYDDVSSSSNRPSALPKDLVKEFAGSFDSMQSDEGYKSLSSLSSLSIEDRSKINNPSLGDVNTRNQVCKIDEEDSDLGVVCDTDGETQVQHQQQRMVVSNDSGFDSMQSSASKSRSEYPKQSFIHSYAQTNDLRYILAPNWRFLVVRNEDGDTSLHLAVINCQVDVIHSIIDVLPSKKYLNVYNHLMQTPLHLAVITRQPKVVEKLLDSGASVDLPDRNGQTCLHLACKGGDLKTIEAIFKRRQNNDDEFRRKLQDIMEARNFDGHTPLHVAVLENNLDVVRVLVSLGAYVDSTASKSGYTPLHLAVEQNNLMMVSYLLFQGNADVNAMSYADCTPLHLAAGLGLNTILATLIAAGADQTLTTSEGETPYDIACKDFDGLLECSFESMEDCESE